LKTFEFIIFEYLYCNFGIDSERLPEINIYIKKLIFIVTQYHRYQQIWNQILIESQNLKEANLNNEKFSYPKSVML
jgi:hypothetical protein